ncbi:MAG TPA: SBBP repeat-containing protein, partial [Terriglobales bacterium]
MSAYPSRIASFPVFFALAIVTLAVSLPAQAAAPASTAQASSQYGRLPLSFELNQGQADSHIKFFSHGRANAMFFTDNEAVLNLQAPRQEHSLAVKGDILRLSLVGARAKQVVGEGKLAGKVNYLQSPVAGRPVVNVPLYSRVKYEAAYPGVDLVYYGNGKQLEYDFQVAPRADSRQIKLKIEGAQGLKLAADGSLIVQGKYGSVRWKKPVAYQEYLDTGKVEIASKYVLHGNEVSFEIGPYNHNGLLVIDPTLVYSTYVGGNDNSSCCNSSHAIAVDNMGAAYIAGVTVQADYPATPGAYDSQQKSNGSFGFAQGFVTKLNLDGSGIVYSTYLTGSANASGIAVDSIGDAYVVGVASNNVTTSGASYSFNTTPGAFRSMDNRLSAAFVLKLSPNGASATYSTVIGSLQGGFTGGIALNTTDASSNPQAYITGYAAGADFPITANAFQQSNAGNYDAFVTAVNGDGSNLVYSTWLGGGADQSKFSNLTGEDQGTGITVRPNGDAIVTGFTRSDNFPQTNTQYSQIAQTGNSDIFVTELNPSGSALVFSTLIGGPYDDEGNSITLDPGGNIYVGGGTEGGNFPMLDNSYRKYSNNTHDGVLFELSADGQSLLASTFLGG